jgi:hypothetical protein
MLPSVPVMRHTRRDIRRAPCPSLANPVLAVCSPLLSTDTDIVTPLPGNRILEPLVLTRVSPSVMLKGE